MEHTDSTDGSGGSHGLSSASRGSMYEFLSYLFARNPDVDFMTYLRSDELVAKLEAFDELLGQENDAAEVRSSIRKLISAHLSLREPASDGDTRLQEEYARLFRGIKKGYGPPPPYESVYRSDIVMSEATSDVLTRYREEGLEVRGGEPPDYIAFELAFMSHLRKMEDEACRKGDAKSADRLASSADGFLSDHILGWVPQFCNEVLDYGSAFYGAVAGLTKNWLEFEAGRAKQRRSASGSSIRGR